MAAWHHQLEFFKLNKQDDPIRDIVKIKLYNQQLCYQQHLRLRFVDWAQFSSWILARRVQSRQISLSEMLTLKLLKVLMREELGLYISRTIYIENFNKNSMTRIKLILNHCFVRKNFLSNSS